MKKIMTFECAQQIAARIWCDQGYSHVVMNPELASKIARLLMKEANAQAEEKDSGQISN